MTDARTLNPQPLESGLEVRTWPQASLLQKALPFPFFHSNDCLCLGLPAPPVVVLTPQAYGKPPQHIWQSPGLAGTQGDIGAKGTGQKPALNPLGTLNADTVPISGAAGCLGSLSGGITLAGAGKDGWLWLEVSDFPLVTKQRTRVKAGPECLE